MVGLFSYLFLSLVFIFTVKSLLGTQLRRLKNLPPGPPTLPIIGNLHHSKQRPHRVYSALSRTYGDIISLWFGTRLVVVVSSLPLVQECFTKNDTVLANRPRFLAGKYILFNYTTVSAISYGDLWRNLRRVITLDVLSNHRINSFAGVRRDEALRLLRRLRGDGNGGYKKVELRPGLKEMTFNAMMRSISEMKYTGEGEVTDPEDAKQFRKILSEMLLLYGANNKGDFLPILRLFDFEDLEKRLKRIGKRADAFLQNLIEEHRNGKHGSGDSMINHLLKLGESQPQYYSVQIIKGLIQAMFLAGTDTTSEAIEWGMGELLNNPEVLKKAKEEIETQIGNDRLVDEQDLSKLPYLQNIVNETLRLHPPAPLLLPHESAKDCTVGGYNIPQETIVLINVWHVHRDPKLWSDPTSFKPERFEKEGEVNKLITFGIGRRACPGSGLAQRIVGLTMALLIQCFEWKRVSEEKIDMMEDHGGATMPKLVPVEAMCKALPIVNGIM